jgi:branched-chain amino acid transport system substrate-binding protein
MKKKEAGKMKKLDLVLIVGLALVVALAGCAPTPTTAPEATEPPAPEATEPPAPEPTEPPAPEEKVIKIGMAVALSGAMAKEGGYCRDGVELWKDLVNEAGGIDVGGEKYMVEVIYYDDKSDAETSARLTEKLITEDEVDFLLGPFSSGLTMLTTTVGEKYGVLSMATMANSPDIYNRDYKYAFAVLPPAGNYMKLFLDMAMAQDPKPETAAVVMRDDPFGISMGEGTVAYAKELGLDVVYEQKYPKDIKDASALLTDIKGLNPDIVVGCTTLQEAVVLTRQAKELNVCPKALAYSVGPTMPGFVESLEDDAEYIFGSEWWLPEMGWAGRGVFKSSLEFAELFEARYDYKPSYHPAGSAAAAETLRLCIEDTDSLDTDTIRECLLDFDEEIFWGPHAYAPNGENRKGGSAPIQIQDLSVVSVYPPAVAQGEPIWPMPCWDER